MHDTAHPDPLGHANDGVTQASTVLAEAREAANDLRERLEQQLATIVDAMTKHLHLFVPPGSVVQRGQPEPTFHLRVTHGHAHGAVAFELVTGPVVILPPSGDLSGAKWWAEARPLRAAGGPAKSIVSLECPLFPFMDPMHEIPSGEQARAFADAYVDHWMCSDPDTYRPLRPDQFKKD